MTPFKNFGIRAKLLTTMGFIITLALARNLTIAYYTRQLDAQFHHYMEEQHAYSRTQRLLWLDEALTQSSRNYVLTGEGYWQDRYSKFAMEPDAIFKAEIANTAGLAGKASLEKMQEASAQIGSLDIEAQNLFASGRKADALQVFNGTKYASWKNLYEDSLSRELAAIAQDIPNIASGHEAAMRLIFVLGNYTMFIIFALSFFIIYRVSEYISRPLRRLEEAVNALGRGEFSQRVPVDSTDETGRLAIAFNKMANVLQDSGMRTRLQEMTKQLGENT